MHDLGSVSETSSHHNCWQMMLFKVIINLGDTLDSRVQTTWVISSRMFCFIEIKNTTYKGWNEFESMCGTGNSLDIIEDKSEITFDTYLLQFTSCLDSFPSGCQLNQDSILIHSSFLIETHQLLCFIHHPFYIKWQSSIHFSRHIPWH